MMKSTLASRQKTSALVDFVNNFKRNLLAFKKSGLYQPILLTLIKEMKDE